MTKAILDIAIEVCDRVTVNAPTTLFGTNDRIARILRVAAKDTLRDLMRQAMHDGVSGFHSQWIFATRPGVYAYQLPTDYYRLMPGTERRFNWPLGLLGPVGPVAWSNWLAGIGQVAVPMGWRIKNNLMHIEPVPTTSELVIIEYLSRFPVARAAVPADLAPINGFLQPIAPLVPREGYLADDGYQNVSGASAATWGTAQWGASNWGGGGAASEMRRIPTSGNADASDFPDFQVRAEEFTADTDTSALDDDHVLSLGLTWRLLKGLRMPYAEARDEYEREVNVFLAGDASRSRTISVGGRSDAREAEPLGNGYWSVG